MKTGRRRKVFERDGYRCRYCGIELTDPTIDHVMPVSRGGTDGMANLVTCCYSCNNAKADMTPEESGMTLLPLSGGQAEVDRGREAWEQEMKSWRH